MAAERADLQAKLKRTISIIEEKERERLSEIERKKQNLFISPPKQKKMKPTKEKSTSKKKQNRTHKNLSKPYKKEYTCSKCSTITTSIASFKRHWKTKHANPKKYMCRNCGSVSSRFDTYLKHRKSFHPNSPDQGYDILKHNNSMTDEVPECVNDCGRASSTVAVPNHQNQQGSVKDNMICKPAMKDMCQFFISSESHNEQIMREFPKPSYMNPAPELDKLTRNEKTEYFISETDLCMQEYIIANTKPALEKRRDWYFVPLNSHEQSLYPERPWYIQKLNESLSQSYLESARNSPLRGPTYELSSASKSNTLDHLEQNTMITVQPKSDSEPLSTVSYADWEAMLFSKDGLFEFKQKELKRLEEEKRQKLLRELSVSSSTSSMSSTKDPPPKTAMELLRCYTSPSLSSKGDDSTSQKNGSLKSTSDVQTDSVRRSLFSSPPSMISKIASTLEEGEIRSSDDEEDTWFILDED